MTAYDFEWDIKKNAINEKKHSISFHEARTVFDDANCIYLEDEEHSYADEDRFKVLGFSKFLNLLLVCYCYKIETDKIRIISARMANKNEEEVYRNGGK